MPVRPVFLFLLFTCIMTFGSLRAETSRLHATILVFVPAYEGCQLWDDGLNSSGSPACVWGSLSVFFSTRDYFALRMPNPLEPRTMRSFGPVDIYGRFISAMTSAHPDAPGFAPYTPGADFFVFNYDWRQDISASAALLGRELQRDAALHAGLTGRPARETNFIIVTHSMGGLVARTLLSEQPDWAARIAALYLVGSPNGGSVKAIRTVVYGPESLKAQASGFSGALLKLLPTGVDQNVTKLTGVTRPSLYELLPTGDPGWTRMLDQRREPVPDAFEVDPWRRYWPSAALEKRLFLDGWLARREKEGRKKIVPAEWIYCADEAPLERLLAQARAWRAGLGSLGKTSELLTSPGRPTRLRLVVGMGVKTPSGVVTEGAHDRSGGTYTYAGGDGDGTVEMRRALESVPRDAPNVKLLHGVPHGKLMGNAQFLAYFESELRDQAMVPARAVQP